MSTKIYTGFKLSMPLDEDALTFLRTCRKQLRPKVFTKVQDSECDLLLAAACRARIEGKDFEAIMNEMIPSWNPRERKYIIEVFSESPTTWAKEIARLHAQSAESPALSEGQRSRIYNIKSGLHLLPYRGETYGIAWGPDDIVDAFLALPGVIGFAYWNNTDPPEDVSDEDWDARGKIWDIVIPDIRADGFLFKLFDSDMDPCFPGITPKIVEGYLKEYHSTLATRWTCNIVRMDLQQKKFPSDTTPADEFVDTWNLMCDATDEIRKKTPRAQKAMEEAEKLLPHTWDELVNMLPKAEASKEENEQ